MPQINPYQPPRSHVADDRGKKEVDIDALDVSEAWKKRFKWLRKAGGPSMPKLKTMSKEERRGYSHFNILAFLFGPFYYLFKGMWKKAITLFSVCLLAVIILELILTSLGFAALGKILGYGVAVVFAVRANIDYYKKMVLRDNGWW